MWYNNQTDCTVKFYIFIFLTFKMNILEQHQYSPPLVQAKVVKVISPNPPNNASVILFILSQLSINTLGINNIYYVIHYYVILAHRSLTHS
jgi:hypothetical protein